MEATNQHMRDLIAAALYTGCRVGELTRLKVRDVADQGFGIYISRTKNYRTRFVFLPSEGMAFFLKLCSGKEPDDLVLTHPKGDFWGNRYVAMFNRAVSRAELPVDTCFHTLRHSYASQPARRRRNTTIDRCTPAGPYEHDDGGQGLWPSVSVVV